jgi:hypothetical protein
LRKKGYLRGIRHVVIPNISLNYTPAFGEGIYNYWYTTSANASLTPIRRSYFEEGIFGGPSDRANGSIAFSLRNTLEGKVRNKKDSLDKKLRLLDNLNFNTAYNIAADSFQWSNLSMNFSSNLFDNKLLINGGGTWDPYGFDYLNGRRVKEFAWAENKKLLRLKSINMNLQTNLNAKAYIPPQVDTTGLARSLEYRSYQYVDFNIPWNISLALNASVIPLYDRVAKIDTLGKELNFTINGNLSISEFWKVTANTGYNFITKSMNVTGVSLVRDLHCWTLSISAVPTGGYRSYNINLQPKSSLLQSVKLSRNKSFWDAL